jgi:hypothetical protein
MQLRRPLAAVLTALALFGGGAAVTGCSDTDPATPNEGTTDDESGTTSGGNDLPDNSGPDPGNEEDQNDDSSDPD